MENGTPGQTVLPINANGYWLGRTCLIIWSNSDSDGDLTSSGVYMIRCGYDGNHITQITIAENRGYHSGAVPSFSVASDGTIISSVRGRYIILNSNV